MSAAGFLDTNIFLRHLRQDHPEHSPKSTAIFHEIEQGRLRVRTADTVIFEVVFTLERHYRHPRNAIRDALLPLIELPGIQLPGKRRLRRVFELYFEQNMPFADAYHAALMEHERLSTSTIFSFDRDFDRIPGIRRLESYP